MRGEWMGLGDGQGGGSEAQGPAQAVSPSSFSHPLIQSYWEGEQL